MSKNVSEKSTSTCTASAKPQASQKPEQKTNTTNKSKSATSHGKPITKPRNKNFKGRKRFFTNSHMKLFQPSGASNDTGDEEEDSLSDSDSKYGRRTLTDNSSRYAPPSLENEIGLPSDESESETEVPSTKGIHVHALDKTDLQGLEADVEKLFSLHKDTKQLTNNDSVCETDVNFTDWLDGVLK